MDVYRTLGGRMYVRMYVRMSPESAVGTYVRMYICIGDMYVL